MPAKKLDGMEQEIVERRLSGETTQELADAYGVSKNPIKRILREAGYTAKEIYELQKPARTTPFQIHLNKYGITEEEYDKKLAEQGGVCAICKAPVCPSGRRLSVDHNKRTLQFRGVLCIKCNQGIGQFDDDPDLLASAIEYLLADCVDCPTLSKRPRWDKNWSDDE